MEAMSVIIQKFRFFSVSTARLGLWLYAEMSVHGCDQSVRFIDLYNVHSLHSQFACCSDPARSRSFVDQWPNRGNRYLFDPSKLFQLYVTQEYNNLFSLIKNGRRQNTKWKGNSILKVEKIEFVISSLKFQSWECCYWLKKVEEGWKKGRCSARRVITRGR